MYNYCHQYSRLYLNVSERVRAALGRYWSTAVLRCKKRFGSKPYLTEVTFGYVLKTLRCDDGDSNGNGNVKKAGLRLAKQQLCTCITLFCTFLCRHSTTTAWKCLISRFMEDVNKLLRNFLQFLFLNLDMVLRNSTPGGVRLNLTK